MRCRPVQIALLLLGAFCLPAAAQSTKLFAFDGASYDQFGSAVAACRQFVVVGAEFADDVQFNSGKVYVWRWVGGVLVPEAVLTPSEAFINDRFGRSLSVHRNVLVVGSDSSGDTAIESRGAAHVFRRVAGVWTEEQRLVPESLTDPAFFGWEVDVYGEQLIVGAPSLRIDFDDDGAAWIYRHDGEQWAEQPILRPDDPHEEHLFGHAVQIQGRTAAISALGDSQVAFEAGAVYIFERQSDGSWVQAQKLIPPDIANWDGFGESIAMNGNWLAVGTPNDDDAGTSTGAVYLYRRVAGTWLLQEKLTASDAQKGGQFGRVVSLDGARLAVGALNQEDRQAFAGAVYMFHWTGSVWRETRKILPEGLMSLSEFGSDVDLSGGRLIAGAPLDEQTAEQAGAAFSIELNGPLSLRTLLPSWVPGWLR